MPSQFSHRRRFMRDAALWAGAMVTGLGPVRRALAQAPKFINDPFQLGVASGDPVPDGFVIWTRLAPDPYDPKALPDEAIPVGWEVAEDDKFRKIVRRGNVYARPELAHSVHVELHGLEQGRDYFYRFVCGEARSAVGRALTPPMPGTPTDRLKLALASCQHYDQGYFTAYRDMIAQDPSLIVHVGDYIYEISWGQTIRHSPIADAVTLADYRLMHAVYKLDPDLQAAHRHCPWIFTWDDHEVDNDYSALTPEDDTPPAAFAQRRSAAYQAFYEHMPLRAMAAPSVGGNVQMFQRLNFGDLVEFSVLDLRQYRSAQPCREPGLKVGRVADAAVCADFDDPNRTMLGAVQENWFRMNFGRTGARWNCIVQSLMMMNFDQVPGEGRGAYTDNWGAYGAARRKIVDLIIQRGYKNVVSLGGDIHSYFAGDVVLDENDPKSAPVIAEFVGTSITSESYNTKLFDSLMPENPNIKYVNDRHRGYVMCDIDREVWRVDFRIVEDVRVRTPAFRSLAKFTVENGNPGVKML
ncbi:MAG: alkaline phosphatase D family protein [Rhodospirillaceae bacterium]|nr:alkaline phosphatase D family protein [Rhodospirillaceae bacterium]